MNKKKAPKEAKKINTDVGGVNVENTLREIRTKFGDDSIMMLGDKPHVDVNAISTGSIGLDAALGVGGLPRGRIVEIFGPEFPMIIEINHMDAGSHDEQQSKRTQSSNQFFLHRDLRLSSKHSFKTGVRAGGNCFERLATIRSRSFRGIFLTRLSSIIRPTSSWTARPSANP